MAARNFFPGGWFGSASWPMGGNSADTGDYPPYGGRPVLRHLRVHTPLILIAWVRRDGETGEEIINLGIVTGYDGGRCMRLGILGTLMFQAITVVNGNRASVRSGHRVASPPLPPSRGSGVPQLVRCDCQVRVGTVE